MLQQEVYRLCASILVLRRSGTRIEVLLLHKPRKRDSWQLPQGGQEAGETLEQAALRELREEAGISAEVLGESSVVYQYDFPASYRRFRPDNVCGQRLRFILARLPRGETVQVDHREIDRYLWVDPAQLHQYIRRQEYLAVVRQVVEEGKALLD